MKTGSVATRCSDSHIELNPLEARVSDKCRDNKRSHTSAQKEAQLLKNNCIYAKNENFGKEEKHTSRV